MANRIKANGKLSAVGTPAPVLAGTALAQGRADLFEMTDHAVKIFNQEGHVAGCRGIQSVSDDKMQLAVAHRKPDQALSGWILLC